MRGDPGAGFRTLRAGRTVLVVDPAFEDLARRLGLLGPDAFERALRSGAAAPGGRGPTALLGSAGSGPRVLLRPLRHGGWLGPLLGTCQLGLRRPLAELRVTAALRDAGAPVPRPALVLGRRRRGPCFECAVGTVYEEDSMDALAFLQGSPDARRRLRAATAAGKAVRRFHEAGGRHPDLQLKNLLVRERGEATECLVVDLDGARQQPRVSPAERMAELMRLYRSLLKRGLLPRLGARGLARFFAAYCAGDRPLRRALRARLRHEQRRIALHALRYRTPHAGK